ncbi:cathelicidin-related peptide Pt_CRAMP2-like isoform X1 [Lissotriton helveticus]
MDGLLKMALLLCMVAAGSSVPLPTHPVTSEQFQLITNAIELLNLAAKGSVFRLLLHDVSLDATRSPQQLNFTIKETDCFIREQAEKENREECDFKDGGIVKECSVNFLTDQGIEAPVVNCTTLEQKKSLVKRSGKKEGVRRGVKGGNGRGGRGGNGKENGGRGIGGGRRRGLPGRGSPIGRKEIHDEALLIT